VDGYKSITSGGNRPHILMRECCVAKPIFHPKANSVVQDNSEDDEDSDWDVPESEVEDETLLTDEEKTQIQDWLTARKTSVLQFTSMMDDITKTLRGKDVDIICVADVSGSMTCNGCVPMDVCVSLSMILSHAMPPSSPYANKILSFNDTCEVVELTALDDEKIEKIDRIKAARRQISNAPWGGSTNLESVFERIAELESTRVRVDGEVVKELVVVIFTDMQFDIATQGSENLLKKEIFEKTCKRAGLHRPFTIVYWDVAASGKSNFADVANTAGVVFLSGYSEGAMKAITTANFDDVTPQAFMISALDALPYELTDEMFID